MPHSGNPDSAQMFHFAGQKPQLRERFLRVNMHANTYYFQLCSLSPCQLTLHHLAKMILPIRTGQELDATANPKMDKEQKQLTGPSNELSTARARAPFLAVNFKGSVCKQEMFTVAISSWEVDSSRRQRDSKLRDETLSTHCLSAQW